MSLEAEIQKAVVEKVAEKLAEKIMVAVSQQINEKWNTVLNELVSHRKRSESLEKAVVKLVDQVNENSHYIEKLHIQADKDAKLREKAEKLLDTALEELNIK